MRTRNFHALVRLVLVLAIAAVLFAIVPVAQAQGEAQPAAVPSLVGGATLSAPTGTIFTNKPTYTWSEVLDSTWYYLWVSRVNTDGTLTTVHKQWYQSNLTLCSTGSCSVKPDVALSAGNYRWWIQTWNNAGIGPWSDPLNFTASVPGVATLVSPTGDINTNYTPAYTWNKVNGATWYYLWVSKVNSNSSLTTILKKWYAASGDPELVCDATTCTVTPSGITLSGGAHRFWVQTWGEVGYGLWSAKMDFSTFVPPLPGVVTLVAPTGSITDTTPAYTWNSVSHATWYQLWVSRVNADNSVTTVHQKWYDASLVCSGGTCSVTPVVDLVGGAHKFWVKAWNGTGNGPWSSGLDFSLPIPWPLQPAVITPINITNDFTPTYIWNAVSSETGAPATWYNLVVNGPSGVLLNTWYQAGVVCNGGGTCSAAPDTLLIPGSTYSWRVRGWNQAGNGVWSNLTSITLSSIGGFDSQFNGSALSWTPYSGSWGILNTAWYGAYGNSNYYVTSGYVAGSYADFDLQTRVATDTPHEAYLIVRGTPSPLNAYADWNSGYYFGFDGYGYFQVGKMVGGVWTTLQPWTYTPYLNPASWNVLRVIASGNSLYYYMNGSLLWSGVDYDLTSGQAGFELGTDPSHSLWIDWVTLNSYYARSANISIIPDMVSPEQQALNEAALNGVSDKAPGRYLK